MKAKLAVTVFSIFAAISLLGILSSARSQMGYSALSTNHAQVKRAGSRVDSRYLVGGIFSAQLRFPVALIGWEELFGGCPDGDTGQWTFDNVPGYGVLTTRLVDAGTRPGCSRPDIYNELYYTMYQPIPGWGISASDPVKAHWQSLHAGPQYGDWQAAYLATSRTRDYFAAPVSNSTVSTGYPTSNVLVRVVTSGRAATDDKLTLWRIAKDQVVETRVVAKRGNQWKVLGQRDFDGDSKADILWGNGKGQLEIWFMDGFSVKSKAPIGTAPADSALQGTGALLSDVDGAVIGDLLWRNTISGEVHAWFMNGSTITADISLGSRSNDWVILGNDNRGDILWQNAAGDVELWKASGVGPSTIKVKKNIALDNQPANWKFAGFGDLQGNGYIDALWHDPVTGATQIWSLNQSGLASKADLPPKATEWTIAQTGDFRGIGRSDILWVNDAGDLEIWFMKGSTVQSVKAIGNIGTDAAVEARNSE